MNVKLTALYTFKPNNILSRLFPSAAVDHSTPAQIILSTFLFIGHFAAFTTSEVRASNELLSFF